MLRNDNPKRSQIVPLDVAKLSIRGPMAVGILSFAIFTAVGAYAAQTYKLPQISRFNASLVADAVETIVRAPAGGRAVEILVKPGDVVAAGQKLAHIDISGLDDQISKLASQAAAARWRLKIIRAMVAKARKFPGASSMTVRSGLASLKDEIKNVAQIARMLGWRLAQARQEAAQSAIFAKVAGRVANRVEWLADPLAGDLPGDQGGVGSAVLKIVNETGPVSVTTMLPLAMMETLPLGTAARVILSDPQTRKPRAFPARLKVTIRRVNTLSGLEAAIGEAIFEIAVPRWQIAKQIQLHSSMNAQVLVETGRQPLYQRLFAIPL